MRARFTSQQLPVKVVQKDGTAYVYICVNETQGTENYPDMGEGQTQESYYEYDYNEIMHMLQREKKTLERRHWRKCMN